MDVNDNRIMNEDPNLLRSNDKKVMEVSVSRINDSGKNINTSIRILKNKIIDKKEVLKMGEKKLVLFEILKKIKNAKKKKHPNICTCIFVHSRITQEYTNRIMHKKFR
jgi:hypothetical protein